MSRPKTFEICSWRFGHSGNRLCIERLKGSTMEKWKEEERPKITTAEERKGILNRRSFLEKSSAALALTASLGLAQQTRNGNGDSHTGNNETQPGPVNKTIDALEPDSAFPPTTDAGGQPPFKYPFSYAHKRIEAGGGRDAPDQGRHSGAALACRLGMGLCDCGIRAHNRGRFEWPRFCRRCQRRRFVVVPRRYPPFHSRSRAGWLPIFVGLQ